MKIVGLIMALSLGAIPMTEATASEKPPNKFEKANKKQKENKDDSTAQKDSEQESLEKTLSLIRSTKIMDSMSE